jgi:GNAT superfamily N-acetyltransferase
MDERDLLARTLASLRSSYALGAKGAADSRLLELDGLVASIVPATPDRSVLNGVVYERTEALEANLEAIATAYESAGVRAWTVWVPEADKRAAELLESAGHVLDASPRAMAMELNSLGDAPGPAPEWSGDWDIEAAGLINDRAYGDPEGLWGSAMGGIPAGLARLYLVRVDGEPASMVMVHDHEDDCVFWYAATVPEARGRGYVSGLLHRALSDARERGCRTTTTEATAMGRPVYGRIGYRDLGALHMYERRASQSGASVTA